jgi:hypothetical protein
MRQLKIVLCCALSFCLTYAAHSQGILKKMKQKMEQTADKVVDKKVDDAIGNTNNQAANPSMPSTTGKNNPTNKGGQGLISTPPNVNENLASAEAAFKGGKYNEARYAVQQAMLGVELEIGQKILKSLPSTIAGLPKDTTADQVTSTGWGWAGLTIHRQYTENDKQFRFTVANNSAWMQAVNLFFTNAGYAQTTGGQQNWKQTKIQDQRAVIEYDQSSGYKLSVPLGQTSLLLYEGINFATEQDFMNAANQINIQEIKKHLGEK